MKQPLNLSIISRDSTSSEHYEEAMFGATEPSQRPIALALIDPSPTNPREDFGELEGLAKSILEYGLQQPFKVRPVGERYEVIFGERRYRACKIAGLSHVVVHVEAMSDERALEIQVIENEQRQDIHPLQKAAGYRRILASGLYGKGRTAVLALAEKLGVSKSTVYGILKLENLTDEARESFIAGNFDFSIAVELASLSPSSQETSLLAAKGNTARGFSEFLKKNVHLELSAAQFPRHLTNLVPDVGSCQDCMKRTGYDRELLGKAPDTDRCLDRDCHRAKTMAAIQNKIHELEAAGEEFCLISGNWNDTIAFDRTVYGSSNYQESPDGVTAIMVDGNWRFAVGEIAKVKLSLDIKEDPGYSAALSKWREEVATRENSIKHRFNERVVETAVKFTFQSKDLHSVARALLFKLCADCDYFYIAKVMQWPLPEKQYANSAETIPMMLAEFNKCTEPELWRILAAAPIAREITQVETSSLSVCQAIASETGLDLKQLRSEIADELPAPVKPDAGKLFAQQEEEGS